MFPFLFEDGDFFRIAISLVAVGEAYFPDRHRLDVDLFRCGPPEDGEGHAVVLSSFVVWRIEDREETGFLVEVEAVVLELEKLFVVHHVRVFAGPFVVEFFF